jgi:hypothetical protein
MDEQKIAELAAQVEPEPMQDRFLESVGKVVLEQKSGAMVLKAMQSNHAPSEIRRAMAVMLPRALEQAETDVYASGKPTLVLQWADLLSKYVMPPMKGVSIQNEEFALRILQIVFEELGEEALDKCAHKIQDAMTQLQAYGDS